MTRDFQVWIKMSNNDFKVFDNKTKEIIMVDELPKNKHSFFYS